MVTWPQLGQGKTTEPFSTRGTPQEVQRFSAEANGGRPNPGPYKTLRAPSRRRPGLRPGQAARPTTIHPLGGDRKLYVDPRFWSVFAWAPPPTMGP